ncbi:transmembrane protein 182 [Nothobranchius furzeri]|uniref:Transmembrane protein 182 n=1 Tax=Nothobranchius furzeri TaxID=105023 RepID=A0A1A7ZI04_NOTFU|nr:transmembrane protein 182 [Nothobranchius furzeri]KAF7215569.1 transmembrane protein 182 [Nothobranchius furzeri]
MKLSVALFFAGLFGALAAVFILLSFGTDYWLLASESCTPNPDGSSLTDKSAGQLGAEQGGRDSTVSYHEGFFWGCFSGGHTDGIELDWASWLTSSHPSFKQCVPAYLYPFPILASNETAEYSPILIYKGFWSIFMLISVAAVLLGGLLIICGAPFASHRLYKAGGGLFLVSGFFLLCVVVLFILWFQLSDTLEAHVKYQLIKFCPGFNLSISYGLSFMFAPIGVFFCLLAGLLFLLIGRTVQNNYH